MPHSPLLTPATIIARHAEQITAEIDGEVVVMGLAQGKYIGLDDVASTLWRLLEQPQSVQHLCDLLAQHYRGDAAEISADVLAFLGELLELGLIQVDAAQNL
ncbi:PqqD family protein [Ferrovibrio sp.]|uniref:PqqD family protein n=1 Tax=Ferrovibrio sp. TaxID=1917215 RepID=UPI001B73B53A|nr:PqqD family protein [Ferrovibrio sp.]MBP7063607.1 PqqD family protein [Ferrovibrio sp.]